MRQYVLNPAQTTAQTAVFKTSEKV